MARCNSRRRRPAVAEMLERRLFLAAQLLRDINPLPQYVEINSPIDVGGKAYFVLGPTQLWKSDGTPQGTGLVKSFSTTPVNLISAGGKLFFVAADPTNMNYSDLWVSNGTAAGTIPLHQVAPNDTPIVAAGNVVYFYGESGGAGSLWKTDGTLPGTVLVHGGTIFPPFDNTLFGAELNGLFYFGAIDPTTNDWYLWKTDGTPAGTSEVEDFGPSALGSIAHGFVGNFFSSGNTLYFTAQGTGLPTLGALMKSDGTEAGTVPVAPLDHPADAFPENVPMVTANGSLFFCQSNASQVHWELWKTDGTSQGTQLLTSASLGGLYTTPALHVLDNQVLFFADDGTHGMEPWVSNGTVAGTSMILDVNPGPANAVTNSNPPLGPGDIAVLGNGAYFFAEDTNLQQHLWHTDGTAAGTAAVSGFIDGGAGPLLASGEWLYFAANPRGVGGSIYKSDGTAAGTVRLAATSPNTAWSQSTSFSGVPLDDGELLFSADDGTHDDQLWKTDGTAAGTQLVDNTSSPPDKPEYFQRVGGVDYFVGNQSIVLNGSITARGILWRTDGTDAGTVALTPDSVFVQATFNSTFLTAAGPEVYFFASNASAGGDLELWKTDGTPGGTALVKVVSSGPNELPTSAAALGDAVVFGTRYETGATGNPQVWRSDGTDSGTFVLTDSAPGGPFVAFNGRVFFAAPSNGLPGSPVVLWETDGTPAGTMMVPNSPQGVQSITVVGGALYFAASDVGTFSSGDVWKTDGTATGMVQVTKTGFYPSGLSAFNGTLLFIAHSMMWRTDGTAGDSVQLGPVLPSTAHVPTGGAVANNLFYYFAPDPLDGIAIWVTDGTPAGTSLVQELYGLALSNPSNLRVAGNYVYFQADSIPYGRELWELPLPATSITGSMFADANHNGIRDAGETGVGGRVVYLDINNNGILDSPDVATTTDDQGNYSFDGLSPGSYVVRELLPAGYAGTAPLGYSQTATVSVTQAVTGPVFGDTPIASVPMDFEYLVTLAAHYQQPGTFADGDLNGDGAVDFKDLVILAANYGRTLDTVGAEAVQPLTTGDSPGHLSMPALVRRRIASRQPR